MTEQTTTPTFTIRDDEIHADWYCDGVEDSRKHGHEQLWRLDFCTDENAFQAQLFAKVDPAQLVDDGYRMDLPDDLPREAERYTEFRLFIARDNRDENQNRIDYAWYNWAIDPEFARRLLAAGEQDFLRLAADYVSYAERLPCDPDYLD